MKYTPTICASIRYFRPHLFAEKINKWATEVLQVLAVLLEYIRRVLAVFWG